MTVAGEKFIVQDLQLLPPVFGFLGLFARSDRWPSLFLGIRASLPLPFGAAHVYVAHIRVVACSPRLEEAEERFAS